MAKKNTTMNIGEAPITLNEHPFYGLKLDKDQEAFRDAIWDESKRIVFCNAKKYSLQGTTQGRYLTGGVPPVRFSM